MSYAYSAITASGLTDTFSIPFPYVSSAHLTAKVNGVTSAFTITGGGGQFKLPSTPVAGAVVSIKRATSPNARLVVFSDGNLSEENLNTSALQAFYIAQESLDESAASTAAANTATSTAGTALTQSATALSQSGTALSQSNTAIADSASAVSTAGTANTNANTAVTTANTALSTANTALSTANAADATADAAYALAITVNDSLDEVDAAVALAQLASDQAAAALVAVEAVADDIGSFDPSSYYTKIEIDASRYTITTVDSLLAAKADAAATTTALAGKADAAATTTALAGKVATSRQVIASGLVTGGGALTADVTLTVTAASAAETQAGSTSSKPTTPAGVLAAMSWVTLTYSATPAVDHAVGVNRLITLTGAAAMGAPSNAKPGWPLNFRIKQDATGGRIVTWAGDFDFGDAGVPVLSTAANAEDLVCFICIAAGKYAFTGVRLRID